MPPPLSGLRRVTQTCPLQRANYPPSHELNGQDQGQWPSSDPADDNHPPEMIEGHETKGTWLPDGPQNRAASKGLPTNPDFYVAEKEASYHASAIVIWSQLQHSNQYPS